MGFWDRLRGIDPFDPAQRVLPEPFEPFISTAGIPVADPGSPLEVWIHGERSRVDNFWRTQPNLRKVVDFVARNVASIPLHTFERISDLERHRVTGTRLTEALAHPGQAMGPYRFWHGVISDGLLYDRWLLLPVTDDDGSLRLVHVPSWRVRFQTNPLNEVVAIRYWVGDAIDRASRVDWIDVPLNMAIFDHGYAPATAGLSPVQTLRDVLQENAEAVSYRRSVWENTARIPGYISRPHDAPAWGQDKRDRFVEAMRSLYTRKGSRVGQMPLFEDGMKIYKNDVFEPRNAQDLEGRRLTAVEVAAAYHIAPELVGAQQGNYSNVREYRQMLYRDSLGPYIKAWEDALNAQLVPRYNEGRPLYVEANVEAKLRGSFEEQAQVTSTATGAPWMTRNEARAMRNLPPVDGGDDLVTPLNVIVGGQASPRDSGSQNQRAGGQPAGKRAAAGASKARAAQSYVDKHREVLVAFFDRQARVVKSQLGAKSAPDWWDTNRWDTELATDLTALALQTSQDVAQATLEQAGQDPEAYDADRTVKFLSAVAARQAKDINATTLTQLEAALASDDPDAAVDGVFDQASSTRADQMAVTLVTASSAFGTVESAKQAGGGEATKTWVVTSSNPRASHAAMNGETVGIDETFSNGLDYPASGGDPDEVAGCQCEVEITIP